MECRVSEFFLSFEEVALFHARPRVRWMRLLETYGPLLSDQPILKGNRLDRKAVPRNQKSLCIMSQFYMILCPGLPRIVDRNAYFFLVLANLLKLKKA